MTKKFRVLQVNDMWELVPRSSNHPIIRFMWFFKHKFKLNGNLERYKVRLVMNSKSSTMGIDCDDTFSHVGKSPTIQMVFSTAMS